MNQFRTTLLFKLEGDNYNTQGSPQQVRFQVRVNNNGKLGTVRDQASDEFGVGESYGVDDYGIVAAMPFALNCGEPNR